MLTPLQSKVSLKICEAVQVFPKVVSDLISSYNSDEDLIQRALTRTGLVFTDDACFSQDFEGSFYQLLRNPVHHAYCHAVKYCLSSSDCDPAIKTQVIKNVLDADHGWRYPESHSVFIQASYGGHILDSLFRQMRKDLLRINLDYVDLSGMQYICLNLDSISAVGANFIGADLSGTSLCYADLRGANFNGANMSNVTLDKTVFTGACLRCVKLTGAKFDQTIICDSNRQATDLTGLITSDPVLKYFLIRYKKFSSDEVMVTGDVALADFPKLKSRSECTVS